MARRSVRRIVTVEANDRAGGFLAARNYSQLDGLYLGTPCSGRLRGTSDVRLQLGLRQGGGFSAVFWNRYAPGATSTVQEIVGAGVPSAGILIGARVTLRRVIEETGLERVLFVGFVRRWAVEFEGDDEQEQLVLECDDSYARLNRPVGEVFDPAATPNFRVLGEQRQAVFGTVRERLAQAISRIEDARLTAEMNGMQLTMPTDKPLRAGSIRIDDELLTATGSATPQVLTSRGDGGVHAASASQHDEGAVAREHDAPWTALAADNGAAPLPSNVYWMRDQPEDRSAEWAVLPSGVLSRASGPDLRRSTLERRPRLVPTVDIGNGVIAASYGLTPLSAQWITSGQFCSIAVGQIAGGFARPEVLPAITGIIRTYLVIVHGIYAIPGTVDLQIENTRTFGAGAFTTVGSLSAAQPGTLFAVPELPQFRDEVGLDLGNILPNHTYDAWQLETLTAGLGGDGQYRGGTEWIRRRQIRLVNNASSSCSVSWVGFMFVLDSGSWSREEMGFSIVGAAQHHTPANEITGPGLIEEIADWDGNTASLYSPDVTAAKALADAAGWGAAGALGIVVRDSIRYLELIQGVADQTQLVVWLESLAGGAPVAQIRMAYRRLRQDIVAGAPGRMFVWSISGPCDLKGLPRLSTSIDDVITRLALRYDLSDARGALGSLDIADSGLETELGEVVEQRRDLDAISGAGAASLLAASIFDWHTVYDVLTFEIDARVTEYLTLMDLISVETLGAGQEGDYLQVMEIVFDPADEWDTVKVRRWDVEGGGV